MEGFTILWLLAAAFIGGIVVGYVIRAFISFRRRAGARRRRRDFE